MDVMREPGRDLVREMAGGERANTQIDAFISRRHEQRLKSEPERALDEAWREADRRLDGRRRRELDAQRLEWLRRLEAVYAARSRECGQRADEMEEPDKIGDDAA